MIVISALVVLLELAVSGAYDYEYEEAYYDNTYRDHAEEPVAYGPGLEHDYGRVRRFGDDSTFETLNPGKMDDIRRALQQIMPGHKIEFLPDVIYPKTESTKTPTIHLQHQFEEETQPIMDPIESVEETVSKPNLSSDVTQMTPIQTSSRAPTKSPSRHAPSKSKTLAAAGSKTRGARRSMTHMPDRSPTHTLERTLTHMPDRFTTHAVERILTHIPDRFTTRTVERTSHVPDRFTTPAAQKILTHLPDRFTTHSVQRMLTHVPDRFTSHAVERTSTHIPDKFTSQAVGRSLKNKADRFKLRKSTSVPVNTAVAVQSLPNALGPHFTSQNAKQMTLSNDGMVTLQDYEIMMRDHKRQEAILNSENIAYTEEFTSSTEGILNTKPDFNHITQTHDSRVDQTDHDAEMYEVEETTAGDKQPVVSNIVTSTEFNLTIPKDENHTGVTVTDTSEMDTKKDKQYFRENPDTSTDNPELSTTILTVTTDSTVSIDQASHTEETTTATTKSKMTTTTSTTTTATPTSPRFDIDKFLEILANLTYDYETNLTQQVNETLIKLNAPTCGPSGVPIEPTEPTEESTELLDYKSQLVFNRTVIAKCFVCGLETPGIPYNADCADAFAVDFLPLVPIDPVAKAKVVGFRKYCRYGDVHNYFVNTSNPRSLFGRWTGGCSVRWTDLSGVYTQRSCRNRRHATTGIHFASKRMAKLEMALSHLEEGCIVSPVATLLPLSRGISLYSRFHACVCKGNWCNEAAQTQTPARAALSTALVVLWMRLRWLSG